MPRARITPEYCYKCFMSRLCLYMLNFADFIGWTHYIGFIIQGEKTHFYCMLILQYLPFSMGKICFRLKDLQEIHMQSSMIKGIIRKISVTRWTVETNYLSLFPLDACGFYLVEGPSPSRRWSVWCCWWWQGTPGGRGWGAPGSLSAVCTPRPLHLETPCI